MNFAAADFFNRWWIRALLNALLRPVWLRTRGDRPVASSGLRWVRLLDACNCYPFGVIEDRCGLWILDHDQMEQERDREFMDEFLSAE